MNLDEAFTAKNDEINFQKRGGKILTIKMHLDAGFFWIITSQKR